VEDMKTYKVMRSYAPVGKVSDQVKLKDNKFTQDLLKQGIITELKIVEPEEFKAKPKRKPRAKKAD
jgi:hypothetical protein